ncbi:MAG: hypothetical protein ACRCUZ_17365 [Shewanella sp.]
MQYQTIVAKIFDLFANPAKMLNYNINAGHNTAELASVYLNYAKRLEGAAATLANITDKNYSANYYLDGEVFTYSQAHQVRAAALAMASGLNVLASYELGSTDLYEMKEEQIIVPTFTKSWGPTNENLGGFDTSRTFDAVYQDVFVKPELLVNSQNFFSLSTSASDYLPKAKAQLQSAIDVIFATQELTDEDAAELTKLQKHLVGDGAVPFITVSGFKEGFAASHSTDYKIYNAIYDLNLNAFFANALSRKDFDVSLEMTCQLNGDSLDTLDEQLSKAFNTPMCSVTEEHIRSYYQAVGNNYWNAPFEYIEYVYPEPRSADIYAQAIPVDMQVNLKAKQNSNFQQVFKACRLAVTSGDMMVGDIATSEKNVPCAELVAKEIFGSN